MYKAQRDQIPGLKTFNQMQWVSKRHSSNDVERKHFLFTLGSCHLEAFEDDDDERLKSCDPVSKYARWLVKTKRIEKPLEDMINFANEFRGKPGVNAGDIEKIEEFGKKEANRENGQDVKVILDKRRTLEGGEGGKEKKGDANSEGTNDEMKNNDNNNEGEDADKGAQSDSESKQAESGPVSPRRSKRNANGN